MSIEIYNKATVIHKDDKIYYFLKYHSKNDSICGGQVIVDDSFHDKYIRRNSRSGSWSVKAIGTRGTHDTNEILYTKWNCPTSYIYGQIMFGNKLNIALYWANKKPKDFYSYDKEQQKNIQECIDWAVREESKRWVIDLENIEEADKMKSIHTYCDDVQIKLSEHCTGYNFKTVWALDNL